MSRTPQGVRGLKRVPCKDNPQSNQSHSARSAWIETLKHTDRVINQSVALRKECVD